MGEEKKSNLDVRKGAGKIVQRRKKLVTEDTPSRFVGRNNQARRPAAAGMEGKGNKELADTHLRHKGNEEVNAENAGV